MGELTVQEQRLQGFKSVINTSSIRNRIRTSLGENAGNFVASMMDLYESESQLQDCDPQKVVLECMKAAALKLPLVKSLGFAYVVPYKGVPTFVLGYRGMIQLAQRSGQYRFINADAVYEGEEVRTDRLTGQFKITGERTSDRAIGYFAYFQLINGYEQCLYMSVEEVTVHARKHSKAYSRGSGPWKTDFDAMAKKTVLRRILRFGPMSTDMQQAELLDAQSAEDAARDQIGREANRGPVLDVTNWKADGSVSADPEAPEAPADPQTVEVLDSPAVFVDDGPDF